MERVEKGDESENTKKVSKKTMLLVGVYWTESNDIVINDTSASVCSNIKYMLFS